VNGYAGRSRGFVLPLPRFLFHPLGAAFVAVLHAYLGLGHLSKLVAGEVIWTHVWKGFGALGGAYVFAALASRAVWPRRSTERQVAPRAR
jgi:hypothetical protein